MREKRCGSNENTFGLCGSIAKKLVEDALPKKIHYLNQVGKVDRVIGPQEIVVNDLDMLRS